MMIVVFSYYNWILTKSQGFFLLLHLLSPKFLLDVFFLSLMSLSGMHSSVSDLQTSPMSQHSLPICEHSVFVLFLVFKLIYNITHYLLDHIVLNSIFNLWKRPQLENAKHRSSWFQQTGRWAWTFNLWTPKKCCTPLYLKRWSSERHTKLFNLLCVSSDEYEWRHEYRWEVVGMNIDEGFSSLQLMVWRAPSGTNQSSWSQHMNDRHLFFSLFAPCSVRRCATPQRSRRCMTEEKVGDGGFHEKEPVQCSQVWPSGDLLVPHPPRWVRAPAAWMQFASDENKQCEIRLLQRTSEGAEARRRLGWQIRCKLSNGTFFNCLYCH